MDRSESPFLMQDWRNVVRAPIPYRIGNTTLRIQTQFALWIAVAGVVLLLIFYSLYPRAGRSSRLTYHDDDYHYHPKNIIMSHKYNRTYPPTPPLVTSNTKKYRIAIISDLDTNSKESDKAWKSYYKKGYLTLTGDYKVSVDFDKTHTVLKSGLSSGGRGMELSELITYDGRILTVDDRTGIVYEIVDDKIIPWVILNDGNGKVAKGKTQNF